jgi:hypothetical protein
MHRCTVERGYDFGRDQGAEGDGGGADGGANEKVGES